MLASVCGAPQRRTEPLYDSAAHLKPHQHHPPHVLPRACRPPSAICGRQSRALTHFLTNMHIVGGFWIFVSWARHHALCCKPHPYPNTQAINCSVLTVVFSVEPWGLWKNDPKQPNWWISCQIPWFCVSPFLLVAFNIQLVVSVQDKYSVLPLTIL